MEADRTTPSHLPALQLGPDATRTLDQAIDMLGAMLRADARRGTAQRADLLRGRLATASEPALRDRIVAQSRVTHTR